MWGGPLGHLISCLDKWTEIQEGTLPLEHLYLGRTQRSKQTRVWWQQPCVHRSFPDTQNCFQRETNQIRAGNSFTGLRRAHTEPELIIFQDVRILCIKHFLDQRKYFSVPGEAINFESIAEQQPSVSTGISPNYNAQWKGDPLQAQHPLQTSLYANTAYFHAMLAAHCWSCTSLNDVF